MTPLLKGAQFAWEVTLTYVPMSVERIQILFSHPGQMTLGTLPIILRSIYTAILLERV